MKRALLIASLILAGCAAPREQEITTPEKKTPVPGEAHQAAARPSLQAKPPSGPIKAFTWPANPEKDMVTAYQIWEAKKKGNELIALVKETTFTPNNHGTFFIKAVNARGVSDKSGGVKD